MQRAMAKQAESERERRAKVIHAEGELQASGALSEAAAVMSRNPAALQLRYLQTLSELGGENNSTIVFPLPIDLIKPLLTMAEAAAPPTEEKAPSPARLTAGAKINGPVPSKPRTRVKRP
jgi:regulator of protease activity HflC (stomatin/prohibitin superfamily)